MWVTRLKIKHDCIIGTRCEKFRVIDIGISFNIFQQKGITYSPQIHTIHGDYKSTQKFLRDIKKDKRVKNLEIEGNSFFCIEVRKEKVPSTFKTEKLIFVKPVFVDKQGFEYWEVASWRKSIVVEFIKNLEKDIKNIKILKIQQTKLTDVYFPHIAPKLTQAQKRAVEFAFEHGYYEWPKRTDLGKLANLMRISVPTFREHLKRAEQKLMPFLMESVK
ncbi:helix-turn-helix domain-containing protein [Candidatus Pacearchaeota archaeon]|nr:helix-turn-helix domain-containing protein [Candidatus Pacearchaeota archaeon]